MKHYRIGALVVVLLLVVTSSAWAGSPQPDEAVTGVNPPAAPSGPTNVGPGPNGGTSFSLSPEGVPEGRISYQGRLLFNGSPFNGNVSMTFRLYNTASGGSAYWSETQSVSVSAGLFTVLLGSVNPIVPNMNIRLQSWLGIQPAGASELTPRQQLAAAPSAIALVPGITMVDDSADGAYAYSFWIQSVNHGAIYSATSKANSYSILGRNAGATADGICTGNEESCASGVTALASGTQNYGLWANANSGNRCAVFSKNNSPSYYSGFFRNVGGGPVLGAMGDAWIGGNLSVSGAKSGYVVDIALNDGTETLRQGDVVVITGYAPPALGDIPVARVQRAGEANATAVMGVVDKLYEPCRGTEAVEAGEACGRFRDDVTEIKPGQYLAVVTLGLYKAIRVDASAGPIKAGDLLATSGTRGLAAKATPLSVGGASFNVPGTVVGKALGGLDSGAGIIPVFVSLK